MTDKWKASNKNDSLTWFAVKSGRGYIWPFTLATYEKDAITSYESVCEITWPSAVEKGCRVVKVRISEVL